MTWRYGCKLFDMGEDHPKEYGLIEVYNIDGDIRWTVNPVNIFAETPEELAEWLRKAADDVEKYREGIKFE